MHTGKSIAFHRCHNSLYCSLLTMRFRPANSTSTAMQSSLNLGATMDAENLKPSRFNSLRKSRSSPFKNNIDVVKSAVSITSPALKKHKPAMVVTYPVQKSVPGKNLVRALYDAAIAQEDSHQNQLDETGFGLLSMEEVLIPAVTREELNLLKKVQAKAQRDAPESVESLKLCRRAIYECGESAIVAARAARLNREAEEKKRQEQVKKEQEETRERLRIERQEELQRRRLQRVEDRKIEKERKRQEMKKQLPRNTEMWREVAFLMTEIAKIKKEQRMWMEAEQVLDAKIEEIAKLKVEQESVNEEDESTPDTMESVIDVKYKDRVANAIEDINLSSLRIERGVKVVSDAVSEADAVRSELFKKYTRDHQFHGYAGVKDPKSLIRILSQDI